MGRLFFCVALAAGVLATAGGFGAPPSSAGDGLRAGFGEADITPRVEGAPPVWLAGYGMGRRATGVHDPLFARAVVLAAGEQKFALVSVDLVGLQFPEVKAIRERLSGFDYVLVSSTHNHEGPDVVGIWGASPVQRGVSNDYLQQVIEGVVAGVEAAEKNLTPVTVRYGTAADESLVGDSRLPHVKDGILRLLVFERIAERSVCGMLVQWNCHPESMGSKNSLITADFPAATVAKLRARFNCPIAYFSGAVGGLMAPPDGVIRNADGKLLEEGDFAYMTAYGEAVADLAEKAVVQAEPISLAPLSAAKQQVAVPVDNRLYRVARELGVLARAGFFWTGDPEKLGKPFEGPEAGPAQRLTVETEVACLRLGELHVACIPGELYPELVYGKVQTPVDPGADYPDAPVEPSVAELLPGKPWLLFGLANDEVGYIIPKRQWDEMPPYAYGRTKSQYGEVNSCGPDTAPILMGVFARLVKPAL